MFEDGKNFDSEALGGASPDININIDKKKIVKKNSGGRKKPVYDARKAIEEAKLREAKEGKKEKPSAFREFVKEMKKISAEEKAGKFGGNSPKSNKNIKINKDDLPIKKNNYIEESQESQNEESKKNIEKEKRIPVHRKKVETKDMIMRRKLHELEKSPPPMLNIKEVKSKIECWGPSNDIKKQKIVKYNIEKENKKITNISKKNNSNIDSKENTALHSASKKDADKSKNKVVDMNKIEEKAKKNALKRLVKIENQINKIDDKFNLDNYFLEKEKKMEEFGQIPYIKKEYNYVKRYSNEIYTRLSKQLISMYQELK